MKTDVIEIYSDLKGKEAAMNIAERFAVYHGLKGKNAMYLRLLTEEAICMIHGILAGFKGDFWIESEQKKKGIKCLIYVSAEKSVNEEQEDQILSVASSGMNDSAKGIIGKIREIIRWSIQEVSDIEEKKKADVWVSMGRYTDVKSSRLDTYQDIWSLQSYRDNLSAVRDEAKEEWDELEKSIIAKIADEVKVKLTASSTEVIIEKFFEV